MTTIVFLHIPKTAGQTVHNALVPVVGGQAYVSPIRVHSQAPNGPQMPDGYRLYSGHLDWTELEALPDDRFVFTVLRDPRERIASFYMYIIKQAKALSADQLALPNNVGMRRALNWSADEYFMKGNPSWQRFIHDHYNNFYCTYFATRLIRGSAKIEGLSQDDLLARAQAGLTQVDRVYSTTDLSKLEADVENRFGKKINVIETYDNAGSAPRGEQRWPKLLARVEKDETRDQLESFAENDDVFMQKIGLV